MIEQINKEINSARKNRDGLRTKVLSGIKAELQTNEKSNKPAKDIYVIKSYKKRLDKGLNAYPEGDRRTELLNEIQIISEFLPKELSDESIREIVKETISGVDTSNPGQIVGVVMKILVGQADGSRVAKIVSEEIKNGKD